jgi:Erv1 / Alr family
MNNSNYWGQFFWKLLHGITILYPEKPSDTDREMLQKLIDSYRYLLPCENCRKHFAINLELLNISTMYNGNQRYYNSRDGVVLWGIKMHNIVNKMLNKFITITENRFGIMHEIKKYKPNDIIYFLKHVIKYALEKIPEINETYRIAFHNLFDSVSYFLLKHNIDLVQNLKNKKIIQLNFNNKKNIITIYQIL